MNSIFYFHQLITIISTLACIVDRDEEFTILTISIPIQKSVVPDTHFPAICELPQCEECYITSLEPSTALAAAHHVMLRTCDKLNGSYCDTNLSALAGWMYGIYKFNFPPGTGYKIGKGTSTRRYVSLVVHVYNVERFNALTEKAMWVKLFITNKKLKPIQNVWMETVDGEIPPQKNVSVDISCVVPQGVSLHITEYNIHTHKLGKLVTGYVVKNCPRHCQWNLIGDGEPTHSHNKKMLSVKNKTLTAEGGDILAARCSYFNYQNITVNFGILTDNEMCKFVIQAIIKENGVDFTINVCRSPGNYTWESDSRLNNIPQL